MRILLLVGLLVSSTIYAAAQNSGKITFKNADFGRIVLTRNKIRATIDLSKEVAGCAYANARVQKSFGDCAGGSPDFRLLAETPKNDRTYLLIASHAAGNCNVCGRCGADEAIALIWLELDKNLRVLNKKGVPVDYCRMDVAPVSSIVDFNEETQSKTLKLDFDENDVLAVEFEREILGEQADRGSYEFTRLEYSRRTPEKGFVMRTEKRPKSSVSDK